MLVFVRSCVYLACSKALLREAFREKKFDICQTGGGGSFITNQPKKQRHI